MLFENAFCTSPVCAPSRFSLITGVHAESAGAQHMRAEPHVPDSLDTYSALMRQAGQVFEEVAKDDLAVVRDAARYLPAAAW